MDTSTLSPASAALMLRMHAMPKAFEVVSQLADGTTRTHWVVMENPASVLFPYLRTMYAADVQYIQPWQFGHPEQKKTGLALHKATRLQPTEDVKEFMMTLPVKKRERIWYMSPGPDRQKERARFFPGIAAAMAEQWGE